ADLKFVLQSLNEGFCDLHDVNLLPKACPAARPVSVHVQRAALSLHRWFGRQLLGAARPSEAVFRKIVIRKRCQRLVRAEGLEPPQLSSLEPKSSASTSSATPASSIMSG